MSRQYASILQFSLKRSMVGFAVLSVFLAVAVPMIRPLEPERQRLILSFLASVLGTAVASIAFLAWKRYQAERDCGEILLITVPSIARGTPILVLTPLLNAAIMMTLAWPSATSSVKQGNGSLMFAFLGLASRILPIIAGIQMVPLILRLWCGPRVGGLELCEHGLVGGIGFTPWSAIQSFHWHAQGQLVIQKRFLRLEIPVNPDDRETIDQVLSKHLPKKRQE